MFHRTSKPTRAILRRMTIAMGAYATGNETNSVEVSEMVEQMAPQALAASIWLQLVPSSVRAYNAGVKTGEAIVGKEASVASWSRGMILA